MKIAIAGFGLEGRSNYVYFKSKYPEASFTIFDESDHLDDVPGSAQLVLGKGAFDKLQGFDLVLRTAGLAPNKIYQQDNHWSSTREFFAECPAKIIGVTGSKGKGTTCSFIFEILNQHFSKSNNGLSRKVHLLGNIGIPALEVLGAINSDDVVVYEMSSFQLWDLERSPAIAVMTLIEPDHLDIHASMEDYIEAKSRIFLYQNKEDIAVYNEQDSVVSKLVDTSRAKKVPFMNTKFVHVKQGKFYYDSREICSVESVNLPGEHNLRNAAAAISAVWSFVGNDIESIGKGLSSFHGLPHRMKFIREVSGVKFYDDSIATTPGSAIAAMKAFREPKILIVGGHDKGANYSELGQVASESNVKTIYIIGANRMKVNDQIVHSSTVETKVLDLQSMLEIVQVVYSESQPGEVVILSPAAASFDMFRDYKDRGNQFIEAVRGL